MQSYSNNPNNVYISMSSQQNNMFNITIIAISLITFSDIIKEKLAKFYIKIIGLILLMISIYMGILSANNFTYYLNKNEKLPDDIPKNNWYRLRYINYIFSLLIFYIACNYFIQIFNYLQ